MKRILSLLTAALFLFHLAGVCPAHAADITVTFLDENGNPILGGPYSYTGDDFDIAKLDTYFPSLSSAELDALGKAAEVKIETSAADEHQNPNITAEDNTDGKPLSVSVEGNVRSMDVGDGNEITVVGDIETFNDSVLAVETEGDAVVSVTGERVSYGVEVHNATDASGNEIPNHADVEIVGEVYGNMYAVYAEGEAQVSVEGTVFGANTAVRAEEEAQITVAGEEIRGNSVGVSAVDEAVVTVTGDVKGYSAFPVSTVDSEGNPITFIAHTGTGIIAEDSGQVNVTGDVRGEIVGVRADDASNVTVNGSVHGGYAENKTVVNADGTVGTRQEGNGSGVIANDSSTVLVTGDVLGPAYYGLQTTGEAEVTVEGNVDSFLGNGVYARNLTDSTGTVIEENQSDIRVEGNLRARGDGIRAEGDSQVTVEGNVSAGHMEIAKVTATDGTVTDKAFGSGIGVIASDSADVTIGGELRSYSSAVVATGSAEVHVEGNTTSYYGAGIAAWNESHTDPVSGAYTVDVTDAVITVDGNVTARTEAVAADGHSVITVNGDVSSMESNGIDARGESQVSASGDITAAWSGVSAFGGADVVVDGNVFSEQGTGVFAVTDSVYSAETGDWTMPEDKVSVAVGGNVTAVDGAGIIMSSDAEVIVQGDVTGGQTSEPEDSSSASSAADPFLEALEAAKEEAYSDQEIIDEVHGAVEVNGGEDGSGLLIINGTVTANGENVPLVINLYAQDSASAPAASEELISEMVMPEMKIYELAPNSNGDYFDVDVNLIRNLDFSYTDPVSGVTHNVTEAPSAEHVALTEEEHAALVETIAAAIQYIIKVDPAYRDGRIGISDQFYDAEHDLYAAHEGEEVSVTFNMDSAYELSATGNYTLRDNGDGTWTLTVQRGGGVTLSAVIRMPQVQKPDQTPGGLDHPAVGKAVLFGRYDLDGDGTAEDLSWKVLRVAGGYARLAMIPGVENIPDDFMTAFNEREITQIREGSLVALDAGMAGGIFGDGLTHPSMYVKLDALDLD